MTTSRGHLNPGDPELSFERFELSPSLAAVVRHVWVGRWCVPEGEARPQRTLTYPALNAFVMPGTAGLHGPDARVQVEVLRGRAWVVGVLLRPAAGPLVTSTPAAALLGAREPLPGAPRAQVEALMAQGPEGQRAALTPVLEAWLGPLAARVEARGLRVNEACRIAEQDPELLRASELAERVGLSPRALERLVREYVGLSPKWLIECRRLQHAATALYSQPDTELSALAAELGYADYAHFSRRYRAVLGETPRQTRAAGERSRLGRAPGVAPDRGRARSA